MNRLAKKYDGVKEYYFKPYKPCCDCYKDEANKLGQLEDIEEEIGIDLITKDKVEKTTYCYYYNENNEIKKIVITENCRTGVWCEHYNIQRFFLPYKNYGKTWALTKEELKNE